MNALLQEQKFTRIARRQVTRALREILSDPDAGFVLRPKAERSLRKSLQSKQGGRMRNLAEALKF